MQKAQYAILRFAKYKGPEISRIEAHDERTKDTYASNPDVDTSRSHLNYHLVEPAGKYRAEAERQIAAAGCRTRTDSVRVVEVLITASPEFFEGKSPAFARAFFERSLNFIKSKQREETIISAVVHMDEKTPHMHLSFVPLTADGRLSAKEIVGNRKKLTQWQDEYWEYMVKKYPDLERGESASVTGRDHIPPRVFKQMTQLTKQKEQLEDLLTGINPLNFRSRVAKITELLNSYIPNVEKMRTQLKLFSVAATENKKLKAQNEKLAVELKEAMSESIIKKMQDSKLQHDFEEVVGTLNRIPDEILAEYAKPTYKRKELPIDQTL